MDQQSPAGFLVVDSRNRLVYANAEAIRVLAYPEGPEKIKSSGSYLAERIRSVVLKSEGTTWHPPVREFISGRRHYQCRSFVLESSSSKPAARTVGILMERVHEPPFAVSEMGDQFHLTCREKETVRLLSEGLTTKEIAWRMRISPNTVKAFFRMIMIKTGASSHSGILVKALRY